MFFTQRHIKRPRADRVIAHCTDGVVAVTLSNAVSRCLGVASGSRLRIGYGRKPGELTLAKGRGYTSTTVDLYQNGSEVAFNIRSAFLGIDMRDGRVVLPHSWRDIETIALDFSPLSTEQDHGRSRHAG